ncbi:MAG: CHAD domain-containing protein, partial [Planctomycetes bacterium]|nr:CHAD domain-containing protein [Planctomycetota bacterium]
MVRPAESAVGMGMRERVLAVLRGLTGLSGSSGRSGGTGRGGGARGAGVEAVHRLRVASRRLRAVLPHVVAGLSGRERRRLTRLVRRLTRRLGSVRVLDVSREVLADVVEREPAAGAAGASVVAAAR